MAIIVKQIGLIVLMGAWGATACGQVSRDDEPVTEAGGALPTADTDTDTGTDTDTDTEPGEDTGTDTGTDTDAPEGCRGPIEFRDEYLLGEVRRALADPSPELCCDDVDELLEFSADGGAISDLTGLQCLTSLTSLQLELDIYGVGASSELSPLDLSPLAGLTHLTALNLNYNLRISDLSPLTGLTNLTELGLHSNQVSDLSPLADLTNLADLDLAANQIRDLSPLANLTSLTNLSLSYNQISDLSPLAGLTQLTNLYLNDNSVSDLSPLADLTNLSVLYVPGNSVSDLSPLADLTNLTVLFLSDNNISDLSALVGNSGIDSGDSVIVDDNPLDCDDAATQEEIATLQERGVHLPYDCP